MRSLPELCCYMISLLQAVALVERNSHWKVKGSYGDHIMFERAYTSAVEDVDKLSERCIGLFGNDVLDLRHQAQLIEKFLSSCTSDNPLDNSIKIEEDFLKANKVFVKALEKEGKMTLGLEDLLPELSSHREESLYLLKQRKDANDAADGLSSERKARIKFLGRIKQAGGTWMQALYGKDDYVIRQLKEDLDRAVEYLDDIETGKEVPFGLSSKEDMLARARHSIERLKHDIKKRYEELGLGDEVGMRHLHDKKAGVKNAVQQDDPNQVLRQKLTSMLTALVISYVPGTYNEGHDITVSVDPVGKKIQGFVRFSRFVDPATQKKLEDGFTQNAVKLLGSNVEGWNIGIGYFNPPPVKRAAVSYKPHHDKLRALEGKKIDLHGRPFIIKDIKIDKDPYSDNPEDEMIWCHGFYMDEYSGDDWKTEVPGALAYLSVGEKTFPVDADWKPKLLPLPSEEILRKKQAQLTSSQKDINTGEQKTVQAVAGKQIMNILQKHNLADKAAYIDFSAKVDAQQTQNSQRPWRPTNVMLNAVNIYAGVDMKNGEMVDTSQASAEIQSTLGQAIQSGLLRLYSSDPSALAAAGTQSPLTVNFKWMLFRKNLNT